MMHSMVNGEPSESHSLSIVWRAEARDGSISKHPEHVGNGGMAEKNMWTCIKPHMKHFLILYFGKVCSEVTTSRYSHLSNF